ncbi:hypothetical protein EB809_18465 [Marinobacter sp. R17]|uniref:DUF6998 domain-containing protein n=1 Tax=Marinobacter sp. R17 TaxID=2484250 RepID=UPI000F4C6A04|nr:hypothetical protein [Marinobacter sp. R17]ROT95811.1 hypothetical protein EB809_18465 [Marinobacter sp. R17]
MALTQMQLIQSLGDAMAWFERELNWGVPPTELRHLCGRIGELYAALITNGQMATEVNQQGYDVVSGDGERISVKTTAMMGAGGHIAFNPNSMEFVDRVIVLRVNTDEMQIETLLNAPVAEAIDLMSPDRGGKRSLPLSRLARTERPRSELKTVSEVSFETYTVRERENGSIEVEKAGTLQVPTKPALRELARKLNISLLNGSGNPLNTRQLGSQVIKSLSE